jgi:hypothetical protein
VACRASTLLASSTPVQDSEGQEESVGLGGVEDMTVSDVDSGRWSLVGVVVAVGMMVAVVGDARSGG